MIKRPKSINRIALIGTKWPVEEIKQAINYLEKRYSVKLKKVKNYEEAIGATGLLLVYEDKFTKSSKLVMSNGEVHIVDIGVTLLDSNLPTLIISKNPLPRWHQSYTLQFYNNCEHIDDHEENLGIFRPLTVGSLDLAMACYYTGTETVINLALETLKRPLTINVANYPLPFREKALRALAKKYPEQNWETVLGFKGSGNNAVF